MIRNMVGERGARYSGDTVGVQVGDCSRWAGQRRCARSRTGCAGAERERIFEPFYRARGAGEKAGGVGLGLSLARQIAREHAHLQAALHALAAVAIQLVLPPAALKHRPKPF